VVYGLKTLFTRLVNKDPYCVLDNSVRHWQHIDIIHRTNRHSILTCEVAQCRPMQYHIFRPHHTIPKE